jgi:hypothetical protein
MEDGKPGIASTTGVEDIMLCGPTPSNPDVGKSPWKLVQQRKPDPANKLDPHITHSRRDISGSI